MRGDLTVVDVYVVMWHQVSLRLIEVYIRARNHHEEALPVLGNCAFQASDQHFFVVVAAILNDLVFLFFELLEMDFLTFTYQNLIKVH